VAFTYRDLEVWQRSMTLVEHTYRMSSQFPPPERFGAASPIRRRVGLLTAPPAAQLTPLTDAVGRLLDGLHNALNPRAQK